jgi:copper chaperone
MAISTYVFAIDGMHCASCGMLIDETLEDVDGVVRSTTSVRAARSTVQADPTRCTPEQVAAAIAAAGYTARLQTR